MKKILIATLDTGGGHRATAEALRDAFLERHGQWLQVDIADLWAQHTPSPLHDLSTAYRTLVDDLPWLYRLIYEVGQKPEIVNPLMQTAARVLRPFVNQSLRRHNPDLIVSVHPLMQGVVLRAASHRRQPIPLVTVVSDLVTIPPVWFDPAVTLCFVPSDEGYQQALLAGLQPAQLRQFGLPIRPAFARARPSAAELRQRQGMVADVPAALIVSGGEGMGPVDAITVAVATRLARDSTATGRPAGQLVVVCGRNRQLHDQLLAQNWPVPVLVEGFVEDIWNWMAACDCIITKAGPGTIAEALALGLPILLSGYIPGQETGNVPYVLKNGVGAYVENPWQIAEVISGWFGPQRNVLEGIARNARSMGRPEAAYQIVEEIALLLRGDAQHGESRTSTAAA